MPVTNLEPGQVYLHGSVQALNRTMKWTGKEVLYIGDNLWADLVEARRLHGWQTACVIHELQREMSILKGDQFARLHELRASVRYLLQLIQIEMEDERRRSALPALDASDSALIRDLDHELRLISQQISQAFNSHFGSVFRTDGNPTLFAFNVRRYVDLYMTHVCDLLHYGTSHRFFPSHPIRMAHDPRVSGAAFVEQTLHVKQD